MFTGIVQKLAKVKGVDRDENLVRLSIHMEQLSVGLELGASVAINGVCLTVSEIEKEDIAEKQDGEAKEGAKGTKNEQVDLETAKESRKQTEGRRRCKERESSEHQNGESRNTRSREQHNEKLEAGHGDISASSSPEQVVPGTGVTGGGPM